MNHPGFRQELIAQHERTLSGVTLRHSVEREPGLRRLAQLESRELVNGGYAVAEVGGEIVAAVPYQGGPSLGDPFRRTEHLMPLLKVWSRPRRPRPRWRIA